VSTAPDALKTQFDPVADQAQVVSLLRAGCSHMRKVLEIEDLNLDDLLATAMEDPDLVAGDNAAFRGIKFADLQNAYRQFCTDDPVADWGFAVRAVIELYDRTLADLPDPARLKGINPSGATLVLDRKGERFTEVFDAISAASRSRSRISRSMCRRRSWRPRTSASTSMPASTNAA
jgi:hypothetical protein